MIKFKFDSVYNKKISFFINIFVTMYQHYQQKSPKKSHSCLFELIENCKHITSQDKLYLRNLIKQNPQLAQKILHFFQESGKPLKKLKFYEKQFRQAQVKIRKYINILKKDPNKQIILKTKENANNIKHKSISPCKMTSSVKKSYQNITQSKFSLVKGSSSRRYLQNNIKSWRLEKTGKSQSKIDNYLNQFKMKDKHSSKKCLEKSNYILHKTEVNNSTISRKVAVDLQYENKERSVNSYCDNSISSKKERNSNYMCIEKTLNLEESRNKKNPTQYSYVAETTKENLSPSFYVAQNQQAFVQSEKIIQKMLLESQRLVQDYEMSKNSEVSVKVKQISSSIKQIMIQPQYTCFDESYISNPTIASAKYEAKMTSSYYPLSNLDVHPSISIQSSPFKNKIEPYSVDLFTPVDLLEQCRRIISKSSRIEHEQYPNSRIKTTLDNVNSQKCYESDLSVLDKKYHNKEENYQTFGKKEHRQEKRMYSPFMQIQLKNSIQKIQQKAVQSKFTVQGILKNMFCGSKSPKLSKLEYQSIMLSLPNEIYHYLSNNQLIQNTIEALGQKLQQRFPHQSSISRDLLNVLDLENEKQKNLSIKSIESFLQKMQAASAPNISEIEQNLWKLYYNTRNQFDTENVGYWQLFYMQIKQQQSLLELCSSLQEYEFEIQPGSN